MSQLSSLLVDGLIQQELAVKLERELSKIQKEVKKAGTFMKEQLVVKLQSQEQI